ncbi:MAG TPA: fatty acid desaturase [Candidatus Cybelea sp.]|jgi:stearoyl-CoA desaturase (delta-9 desaturase)|nr:fatty acid desaturase [Candidatus Cybelea sp.]
MSSRVRRRCNALGLGLIHIGAFAALIPGTFEWSAVSAAAVLWYFTGGLGVALCFHRTLTHRGLRLRKPLEYALSILGTLALQGDPIRWVAIHRKHHAHSDMQGDPHGRDRGFGWAHVNWLYKRNDALPTKRDLQHFAPDLYASRFYRALPYVQWPLHFALAALLFAVGGWSWLIWGMFVRLTVSYHATWLVNSAAHSIGYRSYRTQDLSTNCWWVALISWGEGWHNNHHAFPYSARHGLRWFEIDPTWWLVKVLARLRLADAIRIPSNVALQRVKKAAAAA